MSPQSGNERQRNWILSFADLLSLLLCFMVMTFAMSNIARDQRTPVEAGAVNSIAKTIDWPGDELPSAAARLSADTTMPAPALDLDYVAAVLDTTLQAHRLLRETRVERADDRLVLAMPADLLFATGETKVADEALPPLEALARVLENLSNPVGILGHAGREPLPDGGEPSYWELSLARALAVADTLARSGLKRPIACYGLADSYLDGLPDDSEIEHQLIARRVDLVVYASPGDEHW